ncbi:MAG: GNAT family N-acetyltransferase [Candidatus Thiodiazotropha sp.]
MNDNGYTIRPARWPGERTLLASVRVPVFIDEQGVPPELEWDDDDLTAYHLLALDNEQQAIGSARLLGSGQIGRMAVLPAWRNRGIGTALLLALMEEADQRQLDRLFLHAQVHAVPFYERLGFVPLGEVYEEAGIPHRSMEFMLAGERARDDLSLATLSESDERFSLRHLEDHQIHTTRLIRQARRTLCVLSLDLDPLVYEQPVCLDAIKQLALRSRYSQIRILLQDNRRVVQQGHRLVDLAQRLTSAIEIRKPADEHIDVEENFLFVDNCGYLHRPRRDNLIATACYNDRVRVKRMAELFDEIWANAVPDRELSRLHL